MFSQREWDRIKVFFFYKTQRLKSGLCVGGYGREGRANFLLFIIIFMVTTITVHLLAIKI